MKHLFIDRDGVINKDPGGWTEHSYVTDWKDFHFLPGSLEALRRLYQNGIGVIVVSNQAGVSKGYFSMEKLDEINARMVKKIRESGGEVEQVSYCIHRDEDNCRCRKPKTALFEKAANKHRIDFRDTYIIGDGRVDIMAGKKLGVKTIFVLSGKTSRKDMKEWEVKPDYIFEDLLSSVKWLLAKKERRSARARRREVKRRTKPGEEEVR